MKQSSRTHADFVKARRNGRATHTCHELLKLAAAGPVGQNDCFSRCPNRTPCIVACWPAMQRSIARTVATYARSKQGGTGSHWQQIEDFVHQSCDSLMSRGMCPLYVAPLGDKQTSATAVAKSVSFPKLHMLRHAVDFAERHRFLGRASEAQIESFHAQFNALFHRQHRNQSGNTGERLRRSLADATLRAVQPCLSRPTSAASTSS